MRHLLLAALLFATPLHAREVVIYLAGDSTLAHKLYEKRPETGWGESLQQFFKLDDVRIENHARNGRSTRTFFEEGRWQAIMERVQPGDYVFIQFGHNDGSKDKLDRYTPPDAYRDNLTRMLRETRERGATPVLLTPVVRRRFDAHGALQDSHGEYPEWVRTVASESNTTLLDMERDSAALLRAYGADRSVALFLHLAPGEHTNYPKGLTDNTHFSPHGALQMARLAALLIAESNLALAKQLQLGDLTRQSLYAPQAMTTSSTR